MSDLGLPKGFLKAGQTFPVTPDPFGKKHVPRGPFLGSGNLHYLSLPDSISGDQKSSEQAKLHPESLAAWRLADQDCQTTHPSVVEPRNADTTRDINAQISSKEAEL